jgi:hypothetical protein
MVVRVRQELRVAISAVALLSCAVPAYACGPGEGIALLFLAGIFLLTVGLVVSPFAKWAVLRRTKGRSPTLVALGLAAFLEVALFLSCLLIGGLALRHGSGSGYFVVSIACVLYGLTATAANVPVVRERGEKFVDVFGEPKKLFTGLVFGVVLPLVFLAVVIPVDRASRSEMKERRAKFMPPARTAPRFGSTAVAPPAASNRQRLRVIQQPPPRASVAAPPSAESKP